MKYVDEGMDCKKVLLLFLKNIWIAVLAAVFGAIIGGGIYLLDHVVLSSNREYQAESELRLNFAQDETGEAYQAYNGYTWNDLMSTNLILNATMSYLPDTYTEEEVIASTKAGILSDIRILTITITTSNPDMTKEIMKATNLSLVELGEREKEFISIEVIKETETKLITADSRLLQAVLTGLTIALILSLIAMALAYVLDDRIYVPGDLKCVTGLPFIGFHFTNNTEDVKKSGKAILLKKLKGDMELNRTYLMKENGVIDTLELNKKSSVTEEICDKLRKADGLILIIPYGKMDRTSLAYRIDQLTLQGCKIVGITIENADMRFMKWYYNHL
ncbi:MAG: hypothetical protein K2K21_09050 [Lachnospiraceae bacterium]|nr:hypothetical protein [Lachnospiraceae bacterium]